MKPISITQADDLEVIEARVREAATKTAKALQGLRGGPLDILARLKFDKAGFHPVEPNRPLNLIEQLNQTFTYLATTQAARLLLSKHPEATPLRLNMGTRAGPDIESEDGAVMAEVFAAVTPNNNEKLKKDIEKVSRSTAAHKYVFFMSPDYPTEFTRQPSEEQGGVQVWAKRVGT